MRRLTIIVASADPARFRTALEIAAAQAALDRPARLFLQGEAAELLRSSFRWPGDEPYRAAGLPTLEELLQEALDMEVEVIACQTGLTLSGLAADALPRGVTVGGLISLMADAEKDRLLLA